MRVTILEILYEALLADSWQSGLENIDTTDIFSCEYGFIILKMSFLQDLFIFTSAGVNAV